MPIYIISLVAAVSVYYFNILGGDGLYMDYWWYDIFMHILGGFVLGLLTILVLRMCGKSVHIWHVMVGAFILGFAWEYFEYYYDLIGYPFGSGPYYFDTTLDLINDVVGSIIAAILFRKYRIK